MFIRRIMRAVSDLRDLPYMWPAFSFGHVGNLRKRPIGNYVLLYHVDEGSKTVLIAHIFHAARDYGKLLEEVDEHEDR